MVTWPCADTRRTLWLNRSLTSTLPSRSTASPAQGKHAKQKAGTDGRSTRAQAPERLSLPLPATHSTNYAFCFSAPLFFASNDKQIMGRLAAAVLLLAMILPTHAGWISTIADLSRKVMGQSGNETGLDDFVYEGEEKVMVELLGAWRPYTWPEEDAITSPLGHCTWDGVKCNVDGSVIHIRLTVRGCRRACARRAGRDCVLESPRR